MTVRRGRIVRAGVAMKPALDHAPTEPDVPTSTGGARVLPAQALSMIEEARALRDAAREQAAQIVATARREAEQLHRRNVESAREQAAAELAEMRLQAERQVAQADERQIERSVELAKVLAERIVRRELAQDPEILLDMARGALDNFRRARQTRLLVHPSQVEKLTEMLPTLGFPPGSLSAHPAADLPVGDMRVVSDLGDLTFSVARQLDRLVAALR